MKNTMKKNSFIGGAFVTTIALILVKILGVIYVIPFKAMIGEKGGALYGYGYNIYALFLSISSAGLPFAVSKLTSEYLALDKNREVSQVYKISRNIIFSLSTLMFLILFFLAGPIASTLDPGEGGNTVGDIALILRIVSFAILVVPFLSVTRGFLQGHKIITPGSISQVIEQLVRVLVILVGCYLSLNVFHTSLTVAVGISIFAACVGGLFSLLYLQIKLHRSNLLDKKVQLDSKSKTIKIIKRLSFYAIPYVVISAISNLYEITDMVAINMVLSKILHFSATTTETISSIFTIWGGKINGIILALIIGINTSLTPNIVTSYTKGDIDDVNDKINKSLELILYIIVPLTIFLSIFTKPLWTFFYGYNETCIDVYRCFVFYALFGGVFTVIVNILQSLSKYKEVIISIGIGLVFNVLLDGPFIYLFYKLGWTPANGAVICGIIAYIISSVYAIHQLKNKHHLSFSEVSHKIKSFIIPWIIFVGLAFLMEYLLPSLSGRMGQVIILGTAGIICFGIYFLISYKTGIFSYLFDFKLKKKKNGE